LTAPVDITDQKLVRAYAHPLRIQILGLLDGRVASPSEIAAELGTPLSNTSYHVRQLLSLGFLRLVRRTARRGAIEHHYTAKVRPTITDEAWGQMPAIVKRAIAGGLVEQSIRHAVAAVEDGGFDRADAHHSRTAGVLDEEGWRIVAAQLAGTLKQIEQAFEESRQRLEGKPGDDGVHATVVMMQFIGPLPRGRSPRPDSAPRVQGDELDISLDESAPS
jgi:DNA-binding transcriptional ArsR family regulator